MHDFGFLSIVPTLTVLLLAVLTRRTVESLLAGCFMGLILLDFGNFMPALAEVSMNTMANGTVRWIILVCGLLGSLIAILAASGAASAFGRLFSIVVNSKRKSMAATACLGIAIFIDDYLNTLAVSSSMRQITERYRVSKQMLAYIVDSTAAPISLIIPVSTWAVFFSSLIESNGLAAPNEGLSVYISSIGYMFYPWFAMLLVFLVIAGVFPVIGPMKKAEEAAEKDGVFSDQKELGNGKETNILNFIIPMGALIFFTVWYNIDIFQGVIAALLVTIPLLLLQRALSVNELFDSAMNGFTSMIHPLATVFCGFMLNDINGQLGMTEYVIEVVTPVMSAGMFPFVCFATLGLLSFATSSAWGLFVVSFPIVVPIATSLNVDTPLILGAMLSASAFGSHACFYSDATVLAAKGSGCTPTEHAFTQFPFALVAAGASSVLFLILGNI